MKEEFQRGLVEGEVQFRDRYQLELKSDFFPDPEHDLAVFSQEFYIFLPTSMQVNPDTYSKAFFYQDQTQLIRHKTPELDLVDLTTNDNKKNIFALIEKLLLRPPSEKRRQRVVRELKMLGNVYRSAIRRRVRILIEIMESKATQRSQNKMGERVDYLLETVEQAQRRYQELVKLSKVGEWALQDLDEHFLYVQQFMTLAEDQYFTQLFSFIREQAKQNRLKLTGSAYAKLIEFLKRVDQYRFDSSKQVEDPESVQATDELFQYQRGLLNAYVLDALLLDVERKQIAVQYSHYVGAIAAALAMFVYLILFVVNSQFLVTNSTPFILASMVLYVLKDRIKEGVKLMFQKGAGNYFPDYRSDIRLRGHKTRIGEMREYFKFLQVTHLPDDIVAARKNEYHRVLQAFERPEVVLYARKHLIFQSNALAEAGDHPLITVFRFSIQRFLEKLSDPSTSYATLDQATEDLATFNLPKVYHVNVVVKSQVIKKSSENEIKIRKFRIILDKLGIKRVERVL